MLRRVAKITKKILSQGGFTLVELLVVMGIMAILLTLSFSGYFTYRRQMFIEDLASHLQLDVRNAFVQSISVNNNVGCSNGAAKVMSLKIPVGSSLDQYQYYATSYCENGVVAVGSPGLVPESTSTITPSQNIGFNEPAATKLTENNTSQNTGFLCLVYSSPYGEFGGYYYSGSASDKSSTWDDCDKAINTHWIKKSDGAFINSSGGQLTQMEVEFLSKTNPNINSFVDIYPSGEAAVKNQ